MSAASGSKHLKKNKKGKTKVKSSNDSSQIGKELSTPKILKTFTAKVKDPVTQHNKDEEIHKALENYMKRDFDNAKKNLLHQPAATADLLDAKNKNVPATSLVVPIPVKPKPKNTKPKRTTNGKK